jgi:hypothetical protein
MILCDWDAPEGALDKAAYTCLLVSYRCLSAKFQFSLSAVTLVYLSQWPSLWISFFWGGGEGRGRVFEGHLR